MKRQIFVFVIFASIAQHSFGSDSKNTIKPSDKNVSDICATKTIENATISKLTEAIEVIFTSIRTKISQVTDKNKNVSVQATSSAALSDKKSYTVFAQGVNMLLDTITRLSQNKNSWVDTNARRIINETIEMAFGNVYAALDLFNRSDPSKIRAQFERIHKETVSQSTSVSKVIYTEIRNGRKYSDQMKNMINIREEMAIYYTAHAVDQIYIGIWSVANVFSKNKTGDESNSLLLKNTENETISALAFWTKIIYKSIRVFYSAHSVDQTDMSNIFAALDSGEEGASRTTKQGVDIVFGVMKTIASDAIAGRRYQSKYQSCISEIAEEEAYEVWMETVGYLLDSNSLVQPIKPSVDVQSRYVSSYGLRNGVKGMFDGIKAAQRLSYTECLIELDRLQNQTISGDLTLTKGLYIAARNDRNGSDESLRIVNYAQNKTIPYVIDATIGVFDGVRFLAKVLSESRDNSNDNLAAFDAGAARAYSGWKKEIDIYYNLLHSFAVPSVKHDVIVIYSTAIRSTREVAISEFCKGIRFIFIEMETNLKTMISKNDNSPSEESEQHSSQQLNNPSTGGEYKKKTTVAMRQALNATINLLASTHLANSSAIKSAFSASDVAMIDTIDDIFRSIALTMGEECNENVSEMYDMESSLTMKAVAIFKIIFAVIRSGQKNGTDRIKAAIKQAESEMIRNMTSALHAIHDGIEIFQTEIERGTRDETSDSYSAMKAAETRACSAMETSVKIIITLIRTLVVSSNTKPDEISTTFAMIQSTRKVAGINCQNGLGSIFKSITHDMANASFLNHNKNQPDTKSPTVKDSCRQSTESFPASHLTYQIFKSAVDAFLDLIPKIQPEATAINEMARKGLCILVEQAIEDVFYVIGLIQCNDPVGILAEIDVIEKTAECGITAIIQNYFIVIRYGVEPGTVIYEKIQEAEANSVTALVKSWNAVFTRLRILFYESFPEMDDESRAHLPSVDEIENESRFSMAATVKLIYDVLTDKFVHLLLDSNEMSDSFCPSP